MTASSRAGQQVRPDANLPALVLAPRKQRAPLTGARDLDATSSGQTSSGPTGRSGRVHGAACPSGRTLRPAVRSLLARAAIQRGEGAGRPLPPREHGTVHTPRVPARRRSRLRRRSRSRTRAARPMAASHERARRPAGELGRAAAGAARRSRASGRRATRTAARASSVPDSGRASPPRASAPTAAACRPRPRR